MSHRIRAKGQASGQGWSPELRQSSPANSEQTPGACARTNPRRTANEEPHVSPCLRLAPQGVVQAALTLCQSDQPLVPHLSPLSRLSSFLSSPTRPHQLSLHNGGQPHLASLCSLHARPWARRVVGPGSRQVHNVHPAPGARARRGHGPCRRASCGGK